MSNTKLPEMSDIVKQQYQEIKKYINDTSILLSLLYDLDLLPEQVEEGSRDWVKMIDVATHFKTFEEELIVKYKSTHEK